MITDVKVLKELSPLEDKILDLTEEAGLYTRSDLQGIVTLIVQEIYNKGVKDGTNK